jgi:riboflavin-specific deaminase-like protein
MGARPDEAMGAATAGAVSPRPYVVLSVAMSLDGYIDDTNDARLMLSNAADFDRVDEVRAGVDAILIGANTIRRDNPRLLIRSVERQEERRRRGLPPHPMKVTLTGCGGLDVTARFFSGNSVKLVYTRDSAARTVREALVDVATVVAAGEPIDLGAVLEDLGERKVERLLVEGGGTIHTQLLHAGLVNEMHVVVAPFLLGDHGGARFVHPRRFPQDGEHPMTLAQTRQIGNTVLLRYLLSRASGGTDRDRGYLLQAIALANSCPPSRTAFSVGAVIISADGGVLATGYSREGDPYDHAEEAALDKLPPDDPRLDGATLYSSLEPCSARASRPRSCTERILATPISRIVFAWREPDLFVDCQGAELLRAAGRAVIEVPELSHLVHQSNAHLFTTD